MLWISIPTLSVMRKYPKYGSKNICYWLAKAKVPVEVEIVTWQCPVVSVVI